MAGGLVLLRAVEIFLRISPHTPLPGLLDFVVAPGFFGLMLFGPDGMPPAETAAAIREWLIYGYVFNFLLYSVIVYLVLWWHDRRGARKQLLATN